MKKRCLIATGGGDCPGLNAVIRAIVKRASKEKNWEILGSADAFNGVLSEPMDIRVLDMNSVRGIHVRGGTILGTTNKYGPFAWPTTDKNGNTIHVDRSDEMIKRLQYQNIDAVINIGGDGSQLISQKFFEKGLNIIGVPKTIDNDLSSTDYTFGFQTAVDIATDALDKLVTTAESHHRIIILEVMGRSAGWIALHTALAGGAEVCLIPEISYDINKVKEAIEERTEFNKGFANIVISEAASPVNKKNSSENGKTHHPKSGTRDSAGIRLMEELKDAGARAEIRVTILGHIQRGGIPCASDRILATQFGVKAFEMVMEEKFGQMVAARFPDIISVPIKEAISRYNLIDLNSDIIKTARGIGMSFGD
jgi:6-phosphofructokinase 1